MWSVTDTVFPLACGHGFVAIDHFQVQIDINSEMGTSAVSNQLFLETRFITLYNDAFRTCEFNIEVTCKDLTLLFLRVELDCFTMYL